MDRIWEIKGEPEGDSYLALIDCLFKEAEEVLVPIYHESKTIKYFEKANKLCEELTPYMIDIDEYDNEDYCVRYLFKACEATKNIINNYNAGGLYTWKYPHIFNDIKLFKEGSVGWFMTLTFENRCIILENNLEVIEEIKKIPGVEIEEIKDKPKEQERIITEEEINALNEFINNKNNYIIEEDYSEIDNLDLEKVKKFPQFLKENNINWYLINEYFILLREDKLSEEVLYSVPFKRDIDEKHFKAVGCVYLNDKYLNDIGVELSEGSFEGTDDSAVPVVLGCDFKNSYSLNEKIPFVYRDEEHNESIRYVEVCGFVEKDSYIPIWGKPDRFESLGSYMVIPTRIQHKIDTFIEFDRSKSKNKRDIFENYVYGYFNFKDEDEKNMVEEYSRELGMNYKFISVKESE